MNVSIVIPARLKSSRFPNKILANLCGKPVLRHVWERVVSATTADEVLILADSDITIEAAKSWGAQVLMTPESCDSGTERIVSVLDKICGDLIINVQGDEPFVDMDIVKNIISAAKNSDADIFTPIFKIKSSEEIFNPNRVKCVVSHNNRALYFSRSAIPFVRDEKETNKWIEHCDFFGHIGIYGYKRHVLENYNNLLDGKLDHIEKLEQLRMLENGYAIETILAKEGTIGIDTPEDLLLAAKALQHNN